MHTFELILYIQRITIFAFSGYVCNFLFLIGGLLPRPAYFEKYLSIQKQLRYQWGYNCDVYLNEIWGEFRISKYFFEKHGNDISHFTEYGIYLFYSFILIYWDTV